MYVVQTNFSKDVSHTIAGFEPASFCPAADLVATPTKYVYTMIQTKFQVLINQGPVLWFKKYFMPKKIGQKAFFVQTTACFPQNFDDNA
jgi:hypothetical protein